MSSPVGLRASSSHSASKRSWLTRTSQPSSSWIGGTSPTTVDCVFTWCPPNIRAAAAGGMQTGRCGLNPGSGSPSSPLIPRGKRLIPPFPRKFQADWPKPTCGPGPWRGTSHPEEEAKPQKPHQPLPAKPGPHHPPPLGFHWGAFEMADEPLAEPPRALANALAASGVSPQQFFVMKPGETIRLSDATYR